MLILNLKAECCQSAQQRRYLGSGISLCLSDQQQAATRCRKWHLVSNIARAVPYAQMHIYTHSLAHTAICVQSHTLTSRVLPLLLLLPDKSLSIDPCLCTSEAAAGGKEPERRTRVVNFCLNSDDGKSSVNTPAALFPPPSQSAPRPRRSFAHSNFRLCRARLFIFLLLPPVAFCSVFPLAPCRPGAVLKGEISAFSAVPESGSSQLCRQVGSHCATWARAARLARITHTRAHTKGKPTCKCRPSPL